MKFRFSLLKFTVAMILPACPAAALDISWNSPGEVPVTAEGFSAAGQSINLALNVELREAVDLTVIKNTGMAFIQGTFSNLGQGEIVTLRHQGREFTFVASYFGGSGNDLVLYWKNRTLAGWGGPSLGDGTAEGRLLPAGVNAVAGQSVLAGKSVIKVAGGWAHTLALCADGTVAAWGRNQYGKLGDNTVEDRLWPVPVNTTPGVSALHGKTVIDIAAGLEHSMALCSDGTVVTWGANMLGQLGNNTLIGSGVPVAVNTSPGFSFLAGKKVVAITAGAAFSLALTSDGQVAGWGANFNRQLGDSSTADRLVPVPVNAADSVSALTGRKVKAIGSGTVQSIALCTDGTIARWGEQIELPAAVKADDATSALFGKTVTGIASGKAHWMAVCSDGTVAGWGVNYRGQLGNGGQTFAYPPVAADMMAGTSALTGRTVVSLAAGEDHTLALCGDGTLAAWGHGAGGQLGTGGLVDRTVPAAVHAGPGSALHGKRVLSVAAGAYNSYAVIAAPPPFPNIEVVQDGALLADGTATVHFGDTVIGSPAGVKTFKVRNPGGGVLDSLAVSTEGTHAADFTAGVPDKQMLQPGEEAAFTVRFVPDAAGARHAMLRITSNVSGALNPYEIQLTGTGSIGTVVPVAWNTPLNAGLTAAQFSAAGKAAVFTLNHLPVTGAPLTVVNNTGGDPIEGTFRNLAQGQVITLQFGGQGFEYVANYFGGTGNDLVLWWRDTRVVSWGQEMSGGLGHGNPGGSLPQPVDVSADSALHDRTVLSVSAGANHGLALLSDGTIASWGANIRGELGDGTRDRRIIPVKVSASGMSALSGRRAIAVAAGNVCSAAICEDGGVVTWGLGLGGVLGIGENHEPFGVHLPVNVKTDGGSALAGKRVVAIAANDHMLALCSDGTLAAWGSGFRGALGTGENTGVSIPVAVNTGEGSALHGKTVVAIAAGKDLSIAVCSDGTVAQWGLGQALPAAVDNGPGSALEDKFVVSAVCGRHVMALCSDGTVATWGANNSGQLGNGILDTNLFTTMPGDIIADSRSAVHGKTVTGIGAGAQWSFAIASDGSVAGWGRNWYGQAGIEQHEHPIPSPVKQGSGSALAGKRVLHITGSCEDFSGHTLALVAVQAADHTGPAGGTLALLPDSPVEPFAPLSAAFSGWQDASAPMTYELLLDGAVLLPRGSQPTRGFTAPTAPGLHTLKGRIYDVLDHVTEVTQTFIVMPSYATPADWRLGWFGSSDDAGDGASGADPDRDGLVNAIEWACHLNPQGNDSAPYALAATEAGLNFSYRRSTAAVEAGTIFTVQWSDTPHIAGSWRNSGVTATVESDDGKVQQVRAVLSAGDAGRRFVRLRVTP